MRDLMEFISVTAKPKRSGPSGCDLINGVMFYGMVESYVKSLNTPGSIPSILGSWEAARMNANLLAKKAALTQYDLLMKPLDESSEPIEVSNLLTAHLNALDQAVRVYDSKSVMAAGKAERADEKKETYLIGELDARLEAIKARNYTRSRLQCQTVANGLVNPIRSNLKNGTYLPPTGNHAMFVVDHRKACGSYELTAKGPAKLEVGMVINDEMNVASENLLLSNTALNDKEKERLTQERRAEAGELAARKKEQEMKEAKRQVPISHSLCIWCFIYSCYGHGFGCARSA
jgi:hypothetical protein